MLFGKARSRKEHRETRLHAHPTRPPASVTVEVPARLHLGFLDPSGMFGRRFGSIGLAISGFSTRITLRTAAHTRIDGLDAERAGQHLDTMRRQLAVAEHHHLTVDKVVPPHVGLGSGTQIALAIAAGLRRLHGRPLDVAGDAIALGRGGRSGVGIGLFERGGLVVDGGHGPGSVVAPIVAQLPFPQQWRILVLLDPARQGVYGPDERAAFAALTPLAAQDAARLCGLTLMGALPALAEGDCAGFGAAITEIQACLGDYFAPVQGGRFTSPDVAAVLDVLAREGGCGIGQSSWGPTGFCFAPDASAADRLLAIAQQHPDSKGLDIRVCSGLNQGADITVGAGTETQ
jgi:beta-ribofuranosylaminobenzene 5'-phosphate synthase